jgi:predicted glycoside hydrolase/deacetylase ChbG (UPF0249 family)
MLDNVRNKYALKLKTPELRQEAYRQYCDHIAAGYEKKSWYFDHPTITCTWNTIEKTLRDYAEEFDLELKEVAEAKGLRVWENVLYASARGENKSANPLSIKMIFANKWGWNDLRSQRPDNDIISVQHNQEAILIQMNHLQEAAKETITIEVQGTLSDNEDTPGVAPLP